MKRAIQVGVVVIVIQTVFLLFRRCSVTVASTPPPIEPTFAPTLSTGRRWIDHLMGNDPRVLVVMIGQYRGGELAWKSFVENVLRANRNTDLALCATGFPPSTLYRQAKFVWSIQEHDWGIWIDRKCGSNEWRKQCTNGQQYLGGIPGCAHPGSGGILLAYREIVAAKIRELNLTSRYDAFLLTRTDYVYRCEHTFWRLDRDAIWVREGEEYGGYSDRYVYAFGELFLEALNVAARVCDLSDATDLNLETLQKRHWEKLGLKILKTSVPAFSVRTSTDPTSWSIGEFDDEIDDFNVTVKYKSEMDMSRRVCG